MIELQKIWNGPFGLNIWRNLNILRDKRKVYRQLLCWFRSETYTNCIDICFVSFRKLYATIETHKLPNIKSVSWMIDEGKKNFPCFSREYSGTQSDIAQGWNYFVPQNIAPSWAEGYSRPSDHLLYNMAITSWLHTRINRFIFKETARFVGRAQADICRF